MAIIKLGGDSGGGELYLGNMLLIECDHGKDEDDSMDVLLTNQQETLMPGQKRKMGSDPAVVLAGTS
ncbi:hypothetical protein Tco_0819064 [Tanacetum coccineum]|uniref:Uncharacterized protein n=1 Tax=Tanacetum coccineum TaxID=301880 RepID=A0ABQ5A5G8_9ASTR